MKEECISFITAKLAKEKGFGVPVNHYYYNDSNHLDNGDGDSEHIYLNHNQYDKLYSAPTQYQLQKWLRDEHRIGFIIVPIQNSDDYEISIVETTGFIIHNIDNRATYESILEEALFEALKLI